jgi:hypothetical protein
MFGVNQRFGKQCSCHFQLRKGGDGILVGGDKVLVTLFEGKRFAAIM